MKVFQCTLSGQPKIGDVIDLHQMNRSRGGRSTAGHVVKQIDTKVENSDGSVSVVARAENLTEVAAGIVESSGRPGSFHGPTIRVKENVITIIDPSNESHLFELETNGSAVTGVITEIA